MHVNLHAAGSRATRVAALTGAAGLLSAAAVMGVGGSAFAAETDVPCGTPAQEAVYETIHHPAQPAQYARVVVVAEHTLEEWSVESPGEGWTQGEGRFVETAPAVPGVDEVPEVSHVELEYAKVVVVQEHRPAVVETVVTEREWRKVSKPEETKWFPESRHLEDKGWTPTDNVRTEQHVVTPEVPEVTETVFGWFATDPGAPWTATGESRTVVTRVHVPGIPAKAAEGYTEYLWTKVVPEVVEERLVRDAVEAWDQQVLVSPGMPAGPPCEDDELPEKPADLVQVAVSAEAVDCDADVAATVTTTTTTPYVWDAEGETWVLGVPVTVTETAERDLTAEECPVTTTPVDDEVAGVEEERETPASPARPAKPIKGATGEEVLGVETVAPAAGATAGAAAVPTAVDAGVPAAGETGSTVPALLGGSTLMLLLAGWLQLGRRGRGVRER